MKKRKQSFIVFICFVLMLTLMNVSAISFANANVTSVETMAEPSPTNTADPYTGTGHIDSAIGKDFLKILSIGDRTTSDAFNYFPIVLEESTEKEFICAQAYTGGFLSFEYFWSYIENKNENFTYEKTGETTQEKQKIEDILVDEQWDYIIVQEGTDNSGLAEKSRPYFGQITKYLREKCPSAELVYLETWAYLEYYFPENSAFKKYYGSDQEKMYSMIHENVKALCLENDIDYILPVGTAMQIARRNLGELEYEDIGEFIVREKYLNYNGAYLSSMVWLECFTGIDARKISYDPKVCTEAFAEICKKSAHVAIVGGEYGELGESPEKLPVKDEGVEYVAVGQPTWRFDMEDHWSSVAFAEKPYSMNSKFIVSPKLVSDEAYKGNKSIYMKSSYALDIAENEGSFLVEANKHYVLKFWYKGSLKKFVPHLNNGKIGFGEVVLSTDNNPVEEWTEFTYHFKTNKHKLTTHFGFYIEIGGDKELWVDELKMYEALPKEMVTPGPEITEKSTLEYVLELMPMSTPTPTVEPTDVPAPSTTPTTTPKVTEKPVRKSKKVNKIKFVKRNVMTLRGRKVTLKVNLSPAKGLSQAAKKVKWSIDKKGRKVVKFVKKAKKLNGKLKVKIKALKKGKAKITCKAPSGKEAVCKIMVK